MLRKVLIVLIVLVVAAGILFALGPRVPVDTEITFNAADLGDDLEAYLAEREAPFDDIREGLQKEIIWAYPASKAKTPLSIVFVHGFSASKGEIRPLPDIVARELGANLFYTRLTGHGRDGDAMAEAMVNDWVNDLAEAVSVGRAIGEKVAIISVSTGGGISAWGATEPDLLEDVATIVMISPNFGVQAAGSGLLTLPWGEQIVSMIAGEERSFEPQNDLHAKFWTTKYPTKALLPMAAITALASRVSYSEVTIPALFIFSKADKVVVPSETRRIAQSWGANWEIVEVENAEDPFQHVIAGDALSPSTTNELAAKTIAWIKQTAE